MQQEVLVCLLELDHYLFLRECLLLSSGSVAFSRGAGRSAACTSLLASKRSTATPLLTREEVDHPELKVQC